MRMKKKERRRRKKVKTWGYL